MKKEGAYRTAPSCDSNCLQLDVSGDTVKAAELVIQTKVIPPRCRRSHPLQIDLEGAFWYGLKEL